MAGQEDHRRWRAFDQKYVENLRTGDPLDPRVMDDAAAIALRPGGEESLAQGYRPPDRGEAFVQRADEACGNLGPAGVGGVPRHGQKCGELAEACTNGALDVEIYANNHLYKDREELEALHKVTQGNVGKAPEAMNAAGPGADGVPSASAGGFLMAGVVPRLVLAGS